MPGHLKQVRFAYKNTFHSAPPTPALSFSTSTIPSSSGIITPSFDTHGLPVPQSYGMGYSPTQATYGSQSTKATYGSQSNRVVPHRYLDTAAISWDLRDHHSTITRNHHVISGPSLHEPATNPPMSFIRITSSYLPWSIKVSALNGAYVTVGDVVEAIYRTLRKNISQHEFSLLTSPSDQRRASRGYEERYRRLRSAQAYEEEKRSGMKRVDFLMGHTQFMGITNNGGYPDEWHLNVR